MPPKKFTTPKPSKKAPSIPVSDNDFLDLADEHERSAGKWRAGDAVKATRFFRRAIEAYDEGLRLYPRSFDLVYNKANLEYNLTSDTRILPHLGASKIALLQETLQTHQAALSLDANNTDALFNTGQVLTSLAEAILDNKTEETAKETVRSLLENAVDMFNGCLDRQQREYEDMQRQLEEARLAAEDEERGGGIELEPTSEESSSHDAMETESTSSDAPGEWATVVEAITPEALLDTCTAQLGALTTLIGLYDPSDMPTIESKTQIGIKIVEIKIPALIKLLKDTQTSTTPAETPSGPTLSIGSSSPVEEPTTTPKDEAELASTNFCATMVHIAYLSGRSTSSEYLFSLNMIYDSIAHPVPTPLNIAHINLLSAHADALLEFSSNISERASSPTNEDLEMQWKALTRAQTILTTLSTGSHTASLPSSRLADLFLSRGDVDLFRFRLSLLPTADQSWVKSKPVLVGNAGVFYRGARSYAEKAGDVEAQKMADAKAIVAEIMKEVSLGSGVVKEHWKGRGADVARVLEQMAEEGIVDSRDMEGIVRFAA